MMKQSDGTEKAPEVAVAPKAAGAAVPEPPPGPAPPLNRRERRALERLRRKEGRRNEAT